MSIKETNAYLNTGLPPGVKLTGLQYGLFFHLCYRYDDRKGKGSAYPGMSEFIRATGMRRSTIQTALGKLKALGLITQTQKGYRTKRAEYVPTYALNLVYKSVSYTDTIESNVSRVAIESVSPSEEKCPVDGLKVLPIPVTISTVSTVNTSKYDLLRFNKILKAIPEHLRQVTPGKNFERLLDQCDALGVTDTVFSLLRGHNWTNLNGHAGGVLEKVIQGYLDSARLGLLVAPTPTAIPPRYVSEPVERNPPPSHVATLLDDIKRKARYGSTEPG